MILGTRGAGLPARRRGLVAALVPALVPALLLIAAMAGCASSPAPAAPEETYGGLPTYLPTGGANADGVLTGTAAKPALTTQGDAVKVQLAGVSLLITVTGPEVPGEGLPYIISATTCTWTVTMSDATGPVPITIADFTTLDHLGTVYSPALVPGQPAPPAVLAPAQTVTFSLRAVMTVGEGLIRWSPANHPVASWDFEVEND